MLWDLNRQTFVRELPAKGHVDVSYDSHIGLLDPQLLIYPSVRESTM